MKQISFKKRTPENTMKKVLIYGKDGTGKSTVAEKYCLKNNLNPVCIDLDDTNFTNVPLITINNENDRIFYKELIETLKIIKENTDYDTLIIDGMSSLVQLLVAENMKGLAKYSERSSRWNRIRRSLLSMNKHIILIGQTDFDIDRYDAGENPNKIILTANNIVNEKYECVIENDKFKVITRKMRKIGD